MGFSKIAPPSTQTYDVHSCAPSTVSRLGAFRPAVATDKSCSVFAVSHRLDGLLRRRSCGFVAPRCRSWGSPCCSSSPISSRTSVRWLSTTLDPSKLFPLQQRSPLSGFLPSCRLPIQGWFDFRAFFRWRVRRVPSVLPRLKARCSLGFLLVFLSFSFVFRNRRNLTVRRPETENTHSRGNLTAHHPQGHCTSNSAWGVYGLKRL